MENKASTESTDPIKQILQLIEKKIRNLEKRKSRLDTIREKARNRDAKVELNEEQKEAMEKYDGVVQNIEFAKELQKSVATIVTDHEKVQKKQQKKEKAERAAAEQKRFREVLDLQTLLGELGDDTTRNNFLHGTHGATVMSDADLTHLDNLYQLISPSRKEATNYEQELNEAAEHVVCVLDGRDRPVGTTTYLHLHQLIEQVRNTNYFTTKHNGTSHDHVSNGPTGNTPQEASDPVPAAVVPGHHGNEPSYAGGEVKSLPGYGSVSEPVYAPPVSQPVQQVFHAPPVRPLHDLVPASPFNFLQDSELEANDYAGGSYDNSMFTAGVTYPDTGVPNPTYNIATSLAGLNVTSHGKDTYVSDPQPDTTNFNMQSQTFMNSNIAASHISDSTPVQPAAYQGQFTDTAPVKSHDQHYHGHHGYQQGRGGRGGGYRGGRGGYQRDNDSEWQSNRQYNNHQYNNYNNQYNRGGRGGNRGDGRRRDDRGARQPQSAMS